MTLPIRLHPDPVLRQVARPVGTVDERARALVEDLLQAMYQAEGRGLAAPQVGALSRIFVMDTRWKEGPPRPIAFIDPEVLDVAPVSELGAEACLSIPGRVVPVWRPVAVTLAWTDQRGRPQKARFEGIDARCILHELDHLDGILCIDRAAEDPAGEGAGGEITGDAPGAAGPQ